MYVDCSCLLSQESTISKFQAYKALIIFAIRSGQKLSQSLVLQRSMLSFNVLYVLDGEIMLTV